MSFDKSDLEAIPTLFNGVWYKSRLEARFAETLFEASIDYQYEKHLPGSAQKYSADFWIPSHNLYVEIKPNKFLKETFLFENDIRSSGSPWICVDQRGRDSWNVIEYNGAFSGWCYFELPCKIVFSEEISLFPKVSTVARWSKPKEPDPEPEPVPVTFPDDSWGRFRQEIRKTRPLVRLWVEQAEPFFDFENGVLHLFFPQKENIAMDIISRPDTRTFLEELAAKEIGASFKRVEISVKEVTTA